MIISKNKPTVINVKSALDLQNKVKDKVNVSLNFNYSSPINKLEASNFFKKIEDGLASKKHILADDKFWIDLIKKVYV